MSAETKAALDDALRAHLADEMPDHPLLAHVHLGLATIARLRLEVNHLGGYDTNE